jgi:hypothetical protein
LEDVLTARNPDDQHGAISTLSAQQVDQLVSYLLQIDDSEPAAPVAELSLSLHTPLPGSIFNAGEQVALSINTNISQISKVEYFASGQLIATSTTAPFTANWIGNVGSRYEIVAKVTHSGGLVSSTKGRSIQYGCVADGQLRYEIWQNIPGSAISDLTSYEHFPNSPSTSEILDTTFIGDQDIGDNYGSRISAKLCAPMTGRYTFWIAGDDHVQLRLSTSASPGDAQIIAYHNSFSGVDDWERHATQRSEPIELQEGRIYYIEALHKEGGFGDSLAVGWQLPDSTLQRPIPANHFSLPDPCGDGNEECDNDGVPNSGDNCPLIDNPGQENSDDDSMGDACDIDDDNDGIDDALDNCSIVANPNQADNDQDRMGDVCDNDDDNDTIADTVDNCPLISNSDQLDSNDDGRGDACTNLDGEICFPIVADKIAVICL